MAETEQKLFIIRLYEGGLTSSSQVAVTMTIKATDADEAFAEALQDHPGSIIVYCSEEKA